MLKGNYKVTNCRFYIVINIIHAFINSNNRMICSLVLCKIGNKVAKSSGSKRDREFYTSIKQIKNKFASYLLREILKRMPEHFLDKSLVETRLKTFM